MLGNGVWVGKNSGGVSWSAYWVTRYISALSVVSISTTEQTVNATIVGTGYDGVSYEYSTDNVTFTIKGTSATGTYNATGLTIGTVYYWRARLYKGTNYGNYSYMAYDTTWTSGEATIRAGNTKGWFDVSDLSNVTKVWNTVKWAVGNLGDKSVNNKDLTQANEVLKPVFTPDMISFPGVMKTPAFTWNQPVTIYLFMKQNAWTATKCIIDGNVNYSANIQQFHATPELIAYAGSLSGNNGNLAIGTWGIVKCVFNGVSSKIQVNSTAAVTGDFGAANAGGFTVGANASGADGSSISIREIITRDVADSAPNEAAIDDYLTKKNTIRPLTTPAIVLCFDDGMGRWYSNLFPFLQTNNVRATFYVNGGLINYDNPYPGLIAAYGGQANLDPPLQWSQLKLMSDARMDIQAHCYYQHTDLTTLTNAEVTADFNTLNGLFTTAGISLPQHMAYPGGYNDIHKRIILNDLYKSARTIVNGYISSTSERLSLPTYEIDGETVGVLNAAKVNIDYAVTNTTAVIFYAHDFFLDSESRLHTTSTKEFIVKGIIDYANANGCEILTITELYNKLWPYWRTGG